MPTLYRKYRPQTFADVAGQEAIVQTIQNEIAGDRLSHAYLFSGPRGVGKTTLARLLAKAVSCEKRKPGKFEPCNDCAACNQINSGRHIDIIEIDAASQTGVDNVRENIIENAGFLPTVLKYKIFIIDEVHMLSTSAFNALLKTLEEPPAHVIFILATTEIHKLPATVISRCERYAFKKIPFDKISARLKNLCKEEKVKVDKEVIERIVRKSEGSLRDAESLLGQILTLNLKEISSEDVLMILPLSSSETIIDYLKAIADNNPGAAITLVNNQAEEGVNLDQFAYDLIETLREMLLILMQTENTMAMEYSEEALKELRATANAVGVERLIIFMDLTLKRRAEIKYAPLPQLPLEMLAVEAAELFKNNKKDDQNGHGHDVILSEAKDPSTPKIRDSSPSSQNDKMKKTEKREESVSSFTIDQIKARWTEIVEKSAAAAPSLNFILSMCSPREINGNVIMVAVPYAIHKEKLEAAKNRLTIEQALETIFSQKLRLAYQVIPDATPKINDDLVKLAATFGGEVI